MRSSILNPRRYCSSAPCWNGRRNLIATLGKSESEMARFLDMSLLDELQREGFFERIGK